MKIFVLLLILFSLTFAVADISPQEAATITGEKLSDIGKNTNIYAEILGQNLLEFQEFFMGAVKFITLGFFDIGGDMAFATFLLAILLFMLLYSIVGFVFDKFNFGIAFVLTILAMISIDVENLNVILSNYEAMGITITVVLPILILLAFTFRIYERAYEGKSKSSPFYAEMFNAIFLIFFGVFFIRHSASEDGAIAAMRFISGWILIGLGIGQGVLYRVFAGWFHAGKMEMAKDKMEMREMKREAADKILDVELGLDKKK